LSSSHQHEDVNTESYQILKDIFEGGI